MIMKRMVVTWSDDGGEGGCGRGRGDTNERDDCEMVSNEN
jgi:hypothetical protein